MLYRLTSGHITKDSFQGRKSQLTLGPLKPIIRTRGLVISAKTIKNPSSATSAREESLVSQVDGALHGYAHITASRASYPAFEDVAFKLTSLPTKLFPNLFLPFGS